MAVAERRPRCGGSGDRDGLGLAGGQSTEVVAVAEDVHEDDALKAGAPVVHDRLNKF